MYTKFNIFIGLVAILLPSATSQYFDPSMDDQEYLNLTHSKVQKEVESSRQELVEQVEVVRVATRAFIGAKIKQNLFKALRTLAEKELEAMSMQNRPRQPRQDEDDDEETTTERGLIPQLATIVQAIFGSNVNVTKYVESASKLLPRPIGNQLVGVASLLDPNQFTTTTAPKLHAAATEASVVGLSNSTTIATTIATLGPFKAQPEALSANGTTVSTPSKRSSTASIFLEDDDDEIRGEDEEEEEDLIRKKRQFNFKGINPLLIVNGMESLWKNYEKRTQPNVTRPVTTTAATYQKGGSTLEPEDGFDDDYTTQPSRVVSAVNGLSSQVQALRKGVPDLFQGAREAYTFLQHLNGFLDNWETRLQAGTQETEDAEEEEEE